MLKCEKVLNKALQENLTYNEKEKLIDTIVDTRDSWYIYKFAKDVTWLDEIKGAKEKLINAIICLSNQDDYTIFNFANLEWIDKMIDAKERLFNTIMNSGSGEYISNFVANVKWVYTIENYNEKILDAFIKTNDAEYIYHLACDMKWLDLDNVKNSRKKLLTAILNTNDLYSIYRFIKDVEWLDKNSKKKLINRLIKTNSIDYIYFLIITMNCFDEKLIDIVIKSDNIDYIYSLAMKPELLKANKLIKDKLLNAIIKINDASYIYYFAMFAEWLDEIEGAKEKLADAIMKTNDIIYIPLFAIKMEWLSNVDIKVKQKLYYKAMEISTSIYDIVNCYKLYKLLLKNKLDVSVSNIIGTKYEIRNIFNYIVDNCSSGCSLSIVSIGDVQKHVARIIYKSVVVDNRKIVFKYYKLKKYTDIVLLVDNIENIFVMQYRNKVKLRIFTNDNKLYTIDDNPILISWIKTGSELINLNYHTKIMNRELIILQKLELVTKLYKSLEDYSYEIDNTVITDINSIITSIIDTNEENTYKKYANEVTVILLRITEELNILLETQSEEKILKIENFDLLNSTIITLLKEFNY